MTGKEAARQILDVNGLYGVEVRKTRRYLTNHYDLRRKTVNLSKTNYNNASIGVLSVVFHECDIQYKIKFK